MEGLALVHRFIAQDHNRRQTVRGPHDQMWYIVAPEPAAARVDNAVRGSAENHPAFAQNIRKRSFGNGVRARPALRFRDNVRDLQAGAKG